MKSLLERQAGSIRQSGSGPVGRPYSQSDRVSQSQAGPGLRSRASPGREASSAGSGAQWRRRAWRGRGTRVTRPADWRLSANIQGWRGRGEQRPGAQRGRLAPRTAACAATDTLTGHRDWGGGEVEAEAARGSEGWARAGNSPRAPIRSAPAQGPSLGGASGVRFSGRRGGGRGSWVGWGAGEVAGRAGNDGRGWERRGRGGSSESPQGYTHARARA